MGNSTTQAGPVPERPSFIVRVVAPLTIGLGALAFLWDRLFSINRVGLGWPDKIFGSAATLWIAASLEGMCWLTWNPAAPAGRRNFLERRMDSFVAAYHRLERAIYPWALWVAIPPAALWLFTAAYASFEAQFQARLGLVVWRALYAGAPYLTWSKWRGWERRGTWRSANPELDRALGIQALVAGGLVTLLVLLFYLGVLLRLRRG
jgi:hypothetical protein